MVVIEFCVGNLKGCWKKSLNLLIHQIIVKFDGSCLKQKEISLSHKGVINQYTVYETNFWSHDLGIDFTLRNSLFQAVKWTEKQIN